MRRSPITSNQMLRCKGPDNRSGKKAQSDGGPRASGTHVGETSAVRHAARRGDNCARVMSSPKLADLHESHADEIAKLVAVDNGKPIRDARNVDLPGSYEILRYMAGWATKINGETITVSSPGPTTPPSY
ncbi:MAG: aldehyde dehydrogenase family protein [Alphaproteobacteria bacterium]|nr:aldehyde dehydrogenase family protein [Alphaproteobacteria bacterium]